MAMLLEEKERREKQCRVADSFVSDLQRQENCFMTLTNFDFVSSIQTCTESYP